MPVSSSTEHWIKPDALTINLNHFGDPDYLQVSVLAGAVVMAFKQDVIGYNASHNYRTWPLEAANTYLETSSAYNVYARLTRSEVNARALIVYDTVLRDIEGRVISYAENGSEVLGDASADYFFVYLGQISGSVNSNGQSVQREWLIDFRFGSLDTSQYRNEESGGEWQKMFRLNKVTDMIDVLKTFSSAIFKKLFIGEKVVLDIKRSTDSDEDVPVSDENLATSKYVESQLENLDDRFLSKIKDDKTPFNLGVGKNLSVGGTLNVGSNAVISGQTISKDKITAEKGIQIGESFVPGILTGSGGFFDEKANGEVESLIIRRFLEVPELRYNRVEIKLGDKWNAPGAGVIERVDPDSATTGTAWLKLEDGEYGAIAVGDICMGVFHSMNTDDNAKEDSDDSFGNFQFAGFYTCYFTITEITDKDNRQFRYQMRPVSDRWKQTIHPSVAMTFVSYGSFTRVDRQTSVYTTRTYTRLLKNQNTWEISAANIAMQYGNMENMNLHGIDMTGYSIYLNNIYMTGTMKQMKPDGTPINVTNDRGNWLSGTTYAYYDRVSHNGSLWLCINENGTNTEPKDGDSSWLCQVKAGSSVNSAGRWESKNTPYPANSIVTFADKVWISNKETSNPPFGTYTDKDGNRLVYKDGGYMLVETLIQSEDWDLLLDAPQLTDGKDGDSLQVRYSADKTNWHSTFADGDVWMQQRVGDSSVWSDPIRIVGEVGAAGAAGTYYDYQFAVNDSLDVAPTTGWQDTPPKVCIGQYLWMRTRFVDPNSQVENPWSVARIGGEKGRGVEKVTEYYQVSASNTIPPTTWVKEEMPEMTDTLKYLWNYEEVAYTDTEVAKTSPIVIGMYSKDGNGIKSVTETYGLTNSAEEQPTKWYADMPIPNKEVRYLWNKTVTEYTEGTPTTIIRIIAVHGETGDSIKAVGAWKSGLEVPALGVVTMAGKTFMAKVATNNPPIWTWTDKDGNRLIFSDGGYILTGELNTDEYDLVMQDGKDGRDGKDYEYIYIHSKTEGKPSKPISEQKDDYIPTGWHDDPIGVTESLPYEWVCVRIKKDGIWSDYSTPALWAKFGKDGINGLQGIQGEKGEQGIQGEKGTDGKTSYFHIKYADDANGKNMNESGGDYIGTYVDFTQADSTDPKKYTWVKTKGAQGDKGDQGIPGTNGTNGKTSYLHIAYANSADGKTEFSVSDSTGKLYIGQYTDFFLNDSTDPTKYKWTLIKGTDGKDGVGINSITTTYGKSTSASIMPTSWSGTMPSVGEGEYLWTRMVTDYTDPNKEDTASYTYTYQGKSGQAGTSVSVKSIQYQAGTSPTTAPTGTWSNNMVSVPQGQYLWSKTTFSDGSVAYGVAKQGADGKDGEGFTMMGNWMSGMAVPKMGVVTMGGECFAAKVATTNPPLWCWTDKDGNRLVFSATEYILTGEMNTAEYERWSVKGADGKDGKDGKDGADGKDGKDGADGKDGQQGLQGCIIRDSEWVVGVEYRNDEGIGNGYIDVALVRSESTATGWIAYRCKKTHTSSASITTSNSTYWEEFGSNVTAIFTSLIIAKNAKINFLQGNQLLIQKNDGKVTAGLSGGDEGEKVRFWAGSDVPDSAPFRVDETGNIIAEKGTFGGYLKTTLVDIDNSDATPVPSIYDSENFSAYRLNKNVYVDATFCEVVLPCSEDYSGVRVIIMDTYYAKSRVATKPTLIRTEDGSKIACGLLKTDTLTGKYLVNAIQIDCGTVELIYKSYENEYGFKEKGWIVISQSCGTFEEFNGIGYN